jgi:hypothetical protein
MIFNNSKVLLFASFGDCLEAFAPSSNVLSVTLELPYFFLQVHFSDGLLQPTHTPFLIAIPQVLHGSHPQVWHI